MSDYVTFAGTVEPMKWGKATYTIPPVSDHVAAVDADVDVSHDVQIAIRSAEMGDAWTALSAGKQRGMLYQVTSAKRAETRKRRIGKLLADLKAI